MVRFIVCSDTHLGFDYPRMNSNVKTRGNDFFRNFITVLQHSVKNKYDFIIHCGDLFYRSKVPQKIVDHVYDILFKYAELIPIYIVPGNHERSVLPESILLEHPNLNVFREAQSFQFIKDDISVNISGFPYVRNIRENFSKIEKHFDEKADFNFLCVHQIFENAFVKGKTFKYENEVIKDSVIENDWNAIFCGHIHRNQVRYHNEIPIIYPGSIERTSYQESIDQKGFYSCLLEDNFTFDFIKLQQRPMVALSTSDYINICDIESAVAKSPKYAFIQIRIDNNSDYYDVKKMELSKNNEDKIIDLKFRKNYN